MWASILVSNVFANEAPVPCNFGQMVPSNYTVLIAKALATQSSSVLYYKGYLLHIWVKYHHSECKIVH